MMMVAMYNLWKHGSGLPMNAFPPENYVTKGLYKYFHHPIYIGAVLTGLGLAMYFKSPSGFWLVMPLFILMIIAYVTGFENEIITRVFTGKKHKTFFDLPEANHGRVSLKDRLLLYVWIYFPWFIIYELFIFIDAPKDAINTFAGVDKYIPYLDFSVIFYILVYPLALAIPFVIKTNRELKQFVKHLIWGMAVIFSGYLIFPFIVYHPLPSDESFFSNLVVLGRQTDGVTAAMPSFHVFWALIFYHYFSKRFRAAKASLLIIAVFITISCATTKNHSAADVIAGVFVYYVVTNIDAIYKPILLSAEAVSNSWKEWRFGPIRVINHGFYAGFAGVVGFIIMACFAGEKLWIAYAIGCAGFIGAALWAQFVEGSPMLLRPYGYYGSVFGIAVTVIIISISGAINIWRLLAFAALAAPAIQCFGRLRCLVQGCCHGKPADGIRGIHFCHPKSRVNKIAGWKGRNLYPTQLYSIGANLWIAFLLARLVSLETPASFIAGIYLILNGLSRFVEEYFRGEPQTPYWLNMRVYQWLAILSIVAGAILTCVPSPSLPVPDFNWKILLHAALYGVIITIAYGVDFPDGRVRFSKLTQ